jgi:alpha-tubulin suppressor-like RCC1 family protein
VAWSASNSKATVVVNPTNSNAATVTGSTVGVDTITATAGTHSATSIITITAVPIGTITLSPTGLTLDAAGATVQLQALVKDSLGTTLTGVPLTWTSSNTAIARVDSTGFLTTALIAGPVDITASSGGKSGAASFSVVLRWRDIATSNGQTSDTLGHTCGITLTRAGYCWGDNFQGQGGIGSNVTWNGPQAVIGSIAFTSIATGWQHTCGINDQGAAYCWGSNASGQLGTGNSGGIANIPTPVTGGLVFDTTSITAGREHSCALTTTGLAYCWGLNASGQLGNSSNSPSNAPVAVSGGLTFINISAGTFHTCGVATGGAAYCWGANGSSQLGDNTTSPSNVPVAVSGGLTFTTISGGGLHTCGIASSGNIYCWGTNADGQLGTPSVASSATPTQIFGGQVYSAVDAGAQSTCAILSGGGAGPSGKCWGGNLGYQIGNGDTVSVAVYSTPTAILAPTAKRITMGSRHACIVTTSQLAYCWGRNAEGQVGIGSFNAATLPNIATPSKVIGQP